MYKICTKISIYIRLFRRYITERYVNQKRMQQFIGSAFTLTIKKYLKNSTR